jgi:hypothetical protein
MSFSRNDFPFCDAALSRRLERAEARGNANFIEAKAKLFPESGAEWIETAGAYAMYDSPKSPLTQTFGLGLFEPVTSSVFETLETFFRHRASPVFHEVSPLADGALALLTERGYQPVELTNVLARPLSRDAEISTSGDDIAVRLAESPSDRDLWAHAAAHGWSEYAEFADLMLEISRVTAHSATLPFLATLDGEAVAAGAMSVCDGIALLAGASTIPAARRRGAQNALLAARLRAAAARGCDLAMMCAQPGSASQRNAERNGFRVVYTRIKWGRAD